jgi:tetratricopeptide (TPR) repeat protein
MMRKLIYIALFGLSTVSCKTSFRISVQEPARVKLPQEAKKFGVINAVSKENSPEQRIAGAILGTSQIDGNLEAAERAVEGTLRALEKSSSLEGKRVSQLKNIYQADGSVDWDLLESIAQDEGLDGFIELSKMETVSPIGGTVLANVTGQTNTYLDGSMYINTFIVKDRLAIDQYKVFHSYVIPTSGSISIIQILNDSQRKTEYFKALGFQLGFNAGSLLYPNWIWVNREFYTKGSKVLKRAKPIILKGNWDIAEEQLLVGIADKKEKIKGRVLYNLALVNEGQGDIDEAIKYAKRAALECGNKIANEYLRVLKNRKDKVELINQ